eukprot:1736590-Amphidinium_carterae.1
MSWPKLRAACTTSRFHQDPQILRAVRYDPKDSQRGALRIELKTFHVRPYGVAATNPKPPKALRPQNLEAL